MQGISEALFENQLSRIRKVTQTIKTANSEVPCRVLKDTENMSEDAIGRCREPNFNYDSSAFRI